VADHKCPSVNGGARQGTPGNEQLRLSTAILVVVATKNDIRSQALKVTEVNIANVSGLSLSGVKDSRPPKLVYVSLSFRPSNAIPNGVGSP